MVGAERLFSPIASERFKALGVRVLTLPLPLAYRPAGWFPSPTITLVSCNDANMARISSPTANRHDGPPWGVSMICDVGQGQGWQRTIVVDGRPPLPPHIRQWFGDSRGQWEGNTIRLLLPGFRDCHTATSAFRPRVSKIRGHRTLPLHPNNRKCKKDEAASASGRNRPGAVARSSGCHAVFGGSVKARYE
jgi:hypothetical protein